MQVRFDFVVPVPDGVSDAGASGVCQRAIHGLPVRRVSEGGAGGMRYFQYTQQIDLIAGNKSR